MLNLVFQLAIRFAGALRHAYDAKADSRTGMDILHIWTVQCVRDDTRNHASEGDRGKIKFRAS